MRGDGGGVYLVTGKPGHGKSYYAVRELLLAVERGRYVATNVQLVDGWPEDLARSNFCRRLFPGRVRRKAREFERLVYFVRDVEELKRLRIPACGRCEGCRRGWSCRTEGRGVVVLDEAHVWMNSRTWDIDESGAKLARNDAVLKRKNVTTFFSQHRKLGWKVVLISQDQALLDAQVRGLNERHVHLKNVRRLAAWWNPLRYLPVNVFVAITTWGGDRQGTRLRTEMFLLNKRVARLYDTMAVHELAADDEATIMLGGVRGDVAGGTAPVRRRARLRRPLALLGRGER